MVRELILLTVICWTVVATASSQTTPATSPPSSPPRVKATDAIPTNSLLTDRLDGDLLPGEEQSPFEGIVFYCTQCKKEVPEAMGAGSACPHCGVFFRSATNADGSTSQVAEPTSGFFYSARFWGAIALAAIFSGEYVYRRWRRGRGGDEERVSANGG